LSVGPGVGSGIGLGVGVGEGDDDEDADGLGAGVELWSGVAVGAGTSVWFGAGVAETSVARRGVGDGPAGVLEVGRTVVAGAPVVAAVGRSVGDAFDAPAGDPSGGRVAVAGE